MPTVATSILKAKHGVGPVGPNHSRGVSPTGSDPPVPHAFEDRRLNFGMVPHTVYTIISKAKHQVGLEDPTMVERLVVHRGANPPLACIFEDRNLKFGKGMQLA